MPQYLDPTSAAAVDLALAAATASSYKHSNKIILFINSTDDYLLEQWLPTPGFHKKIEFFIFQHTYISLASGDCKIDGGNVWLQTQSIQQPSWIYLPDLD